MKVLVKYLHPVYVEIDLDDGAVERVVVDDEASVAPDEVVDLTRGAVADDVHDRVLTIAETDTCPSSEFGW